MQVEFDHYAVLLAEDSPDDALLMLKAWKTAGLKNRLCHVEDGEQAVAYLKGQGTYADREQHPFPISMFLDLKLPRIDGLDVLAEVRATPHLSRLNVDVLSASVRSSDIDRALELGANSYLVKPSRFDSLVTMLRGWQTVALCRMFFIPAAQK